MQQYSIPVLDLNDYLSGDAQQKVKFVKGVGNALKDVGFFALTNHSLTDALIAKGYEQSRLLFDLPLDTKETYDIKGLKGQRGYTSFGKEHAKDSKAPDLKEFWHVGQESQVEKNNYPDNIWPSELNNFRPVMVELFSRLESCAMSILEACSIFLEEEIDLIRNMADGGNSILRLIHYPPVSLDRHPQSIRAAAHEDINLITLLIEATSSGLEILDRSGNWLPVITPSNCIIVDAGDMLQNLTNGFFKSTTHRVVNPDNSREPRYSMPFFVHARGEVSLNPLRSCVEFAGKQLYPNITADEYLMQRLKEIGLA